MKHYIITFAWKDDSQLHYLDPALEVYRDTFEEASETALADAFRFTRDWDKVPRIMMAFFSEVDDDGNEIDASVVQWCKSTIEQYKNREALNCMLYLNDKERLEIMSHFCKWCGANTAYKQCTCVRDE